MCLGKETFACVETQSESTQEESKQQIVCFDARCMQAFNALVTPRVADMLAKFKLETRGIALAGADSQLMIEFFHAKGTTQ